MHCSTAPVNHSSRALVTLDKPATRKESRFISQIFTSLLTRDQIAQVDRYPKSCGKIFSFCYETSSSLLFCMFRYQVSYFCTLPRQHGLKCGILTTLKLDETEGFGCLGHSNWTICSPLSPFCAKRFSTFSLSYWEANSYYPRGLIMGKGNSPNFKTG